MKKFLLMTLAISLNCFALGNTFTADECRSNVRGYLEARRALGDTEVANQLQTALQQQNPCVVMKSNPEIMQQVQMTQNAFEKANKAVADFKTRQEAN